MSPNRFDVGASKHNYDRVNRLQIEHAIGYTTSFSTGFENQEQSVARKLPVAATYSMVHPFRQLRERKRTPLTYPKGRRSD